MKAKIKIGGIEVEFEYASAGQFCEIYNCIMQESVVVNEQKGDLEDVTNKLEKTLDEQGACKPAHTPIWQYPHFTIGGYTYKPYPQTFAPGDE